MEHIELLESDCFQGKPFQVWFVPINHKYLDNLVESKVVSSNKLWRFAPLVDSYKTLESISKAINPLNLGKSFDKKSLIESLHNWVSVVKERDFFFCYMPNKQLVFGEIMGPCISNAKKPNLHMRGCRSVIWCNQVFDAHMVLEKDNYPRFFDQQFKSVECLSEQFKKAFLTSILERSSDWQKPLISSIASRFTPEALHTISPYHFVQWSQFVKTHPLSLKALQAFRKTGNFPAVSESENQDIHSSPTLAQAIEHTATLNHHDEDTQASASALSNEPAPASTKDTALAQPVKNSATQEPSLLDSSMYDLVIQASSALDLNVNNATDYSAALKSLRRQPVKALPHALQTPFNLLSALDILSSPEQGSLHSADFAVNSTTVKKFSPSWIATHAKRMQFYVLTIMGLNAKTDFNPRPLGVTPPPLSEPVKNETAGAVSSELAALQEQLWPQSKEGEESVVSEQSGEALASAKVSASTSGVSSPPDTFCSPIEGAFSDVKSETNHVAYAILAPEYVKKQSLEPKNFHHFKDFGHRFKAIMHRNIRERLSKVYVTQDFAALISELLKAQGFTVQYVTYNAIGPMLLASDGRLGAMSKSFCVQLYPSFESCTVSSLDILRGIMVQQSLTNALLVSWEGFSTELKNAQAADFLSFRLWDDQDILEQFLALYPLLSEQVKTKVPLKQVWCLKR